MTRKIVNPPQPTPNPDAPHAPAAGARRGSPCPVGAHEAASEEPTYDSCFDDLNVILARSIEQPDPDPNLDPPPAAHSSGSEPVPPFLQHRGQEPRTSEIFQAVGPDVVGDSGPEAPSSLVGDPESFPQRQLEDGPAGEVSGEHWALV